MPKVRIRKTAARSSKRGLDTQRAPGELPPRLRGEFFTDSYAQIFEDEGKKLYDDIISELVGGSSLDAAGNTVEVKGKIPELFERAVSQLTETLKHKKGVDGLKDNAQFFAPWIKAIVDDVRTTGMKEIMKPLESLAQEYSVKVADEGLLEQPIPDLGPEPEPGTEEEPVPEEMALPEAVGTPEIPELSATEVEDMLKGEELPAVTPTPAGAVAPATPAPAGAAPGTPLPNLAPAPQPAAAARTMKDMRRILLDRRTTRRVVGEPTKDDLLRAAEAQLKELDSDA
jgi:hypothetical protein